MSYKDVVLKSRPAQYYTLDNPTTGHKDLSGFGNHMTSALVDFAAPVVPGSDIGLIVDTSIPNPVEIFSGTRNSRDFTVEFWTNPGLWTSGISGTNSHGYLTTGLGNIFFNRDKFSCTFNGTGGAYYECNFQVPRLDGRYHVVLIKVKNTIVFVVNGQVGWPTTLPDDFVFSGAYSTFGTAFPSPMSHLAIYNRALKIDEIESHYEAGNRDWSYKEVCMSDGAEFYPMSTENVAMAFDTKIGPESWSKGIQQNVIIDRDGMLALRQTNPLLLFDNGVPVSEWDATFSGTAGLDMGTTYYLVKDDPKSVINVSRWAISSHMISAAAPATKKILMTILNKNRNKSWTWYIDSSRIPHLDVVQNYADGTSTTTSYAYSTAVTNGDNLYVWYVESGRVKIYTGNPTDTVANQYAGSDWINEDIVVDATTEIIWGADQTLTGPPMDTIVNINFWDQVDTSSPTHFNNFDAQFGTSVFYDLDFWFVATVWGRWTYTFSIPYVGAYSGHAFSWKGAYFSTSGDNDITVSYNGSAFTSNVQYSLQNQPIKNFPLTGNLGTTQVNGPFTVIVEMYAPLFRQEPPPRLEELQFRVYADNNFRSAVSDDKFVSQTLGTAFADKYVDPSKAPRQPTALFWAADRLEFPAGTYKTIEFTCMNGFSIGEILCARETSGGTERNIAFGTSDILTWTGFDAVYVNGAPWTSGATMISGTMTHIIATYSAGITNKINFGAHYNGTLNPITSGLYSVALYDRVLTAAEITEHADAAHGHIGGYSDHHDSIQIYDYLPPNPYTYAWQQTGSPK